MKHISELQATLSNFFDWHKSRLNCLVQILQALFAVRTVNLTQIAAAFKTSVKEEASYRRVWSIFHRILIRHRHYRLIGSPAISSWRQVHPNPRSNELEMGEIPHQHPRTLSGLLGHQYSYLLGRSGP